MLQLAIRRSQIWKDGLDSWAELAMGSHAKVVSEATIECFELATSTQPSVKVTGGTYQEGFVPIDTGELIESQRVTVNGSTTASGIGSPQAGVPDRITQRTNVSLLFDAPHARLAEYGNGSYNGRFYVRNAVQQWRRIVDEAAQRHKI